MNPFFWEVGVPDEFLGNVPNERGLWFSTELDRTRQTAIKEFRNAVLPTIRDLIHKKLTPRQKEIIHLHFFEGRTQMDIAAQLGLRQSTVSRHLFGTRRGGKLLGGAVPKLRRLINRRCPENISRELNKLVATLQRTTEQ